MISELNRFRALRSFGRPLADAERVSSLDVLFQAISAVVIEVTERGSLAQTELVHSLR